MTDSDDEFARLMAHADKPFEEAMEALGDDNDMHALLKAHGAHADETGGGSLDEMELDPEDVDDPELRALILEERRIKASAKLSPEQRLEKLRTDRQNLRREAALANRAGKRQEALDLLRRSKELESQIAQLEQSLAPELPEDAATNSEQKRVIASRATSYKDAVRQAKSTQNDAMAAELLEQLKQLHGTFVALRDDESKVLTKEEWLQLPQELQKTPPSPAPATPVSGVGQKEAAVDALIAAIGDDDSKHADEEEDVLTMAALEECLQMHQSLLKRHPRNESLCDNIELLNDMKQMLLDGDVLSLDDLPELPPAELLESEETPVEQNTEFVEKTVKTQQVVQQKSPTPVSEVLDIGAIERRIHDYKVATVRARKQGDMTLAKKLFTQYKALQQVEAAVIVGDTDSVNWEGIPPALKPSEETEAAKVEIAPPAKPERSEAERHNFRDLAQQLQQQHDRCGELARATLQCGDRDTARSLVRLQKLTESSQARLAQLETDESVLECPQVERSMKTVAVSVRNTDIADDKIHFEIESITPVDSKYQRASLYVTWDECAPFFAGGKIDMRQCPHKLVGNFRRDRKTQRYLRSSSLSFSLYNKRTLWSDTCLGTATLKLRELLKQCDVAHNVAVVDDDRHVVAHLKLKLRTRRPLEGEQKQEHEVPIVLLPAQQKPPRKQEAPQVQQESPRAMNAPAAQAVSGIPEVVLANPLAVPLYASAEALQIGVEEAQNKLVEYRGMAREAPKAKQQQFVQLANKEEKRLRDLSQRQMQLQVAIQTGQLSLHDYVELLERSIHEDRPLAAALNKLGRVAEAKQVLRRYKATQKEHAQAKEMLSQMDDDE
ncbi:MAG: hypothetical protein MHM6MM_005744 [Cercozoa sp. M6MM]